MLAAFDESDSTSGWYGKDQSRPCMDGMRLAEISLFMNTTLSGQEAEEEEEENESELSDSRARSNGLRLWLLCLVLRSTPRPCQPVLAVCSQLLAGLGALVVQSRGCSLAVRSAA